MSESFKFPFGEGTPSGDLEKGPEKYYKFFLFPKGFNPNADPKDVKKKGPIPFFVCEAESIKEARIKAENHFRSHIVKGEVLSVGEEMDPQEVQRFRPRFEE